MESGRRGEQWQVGMRVKVWNRYETPGQLREGVIVHRSWGRDRGAPIYWFRVRLDGLENVCVFGPGDLQQPDA
jgi:hypothetical protein